MRLVIACLMVLLAGCEDRGSFDKRYDETANEIQNRAAQIETDLNGTVSGAETEAEPSTHTRQE